MSVVVYQNQDGTCSVIYPAPGFSVESVVASSVPANTQYVVIDNADIPQNRKYRGAWKANTETNQLEFDMTKAKEIHKTHLRKARKPILDDLDVEYIKADEQGNTALKMEIANTKNILRNITINSSINTAQTITQLMNVWPTILGTNPLI